MWQLNMALRGVPPSTSSNRTAVSSTAAALWAKHLGRVQAEPRGWPGIGRSDERPSFVGPCRGHDGK